MRKKINLLIHLAKVDGHFHQSERDLLRSLLAQHGIAETYLEEHPLTGADLENFSSTSDRVELLFWVLKLIHADGQLHRAELDYAKSISLQLGYSSRLVDHFCSHPLQSLAQFENEVRDFKIPQL